MNAKRGLMVSEAAARIGAEAAEFIAWFNSAAGTELGADAPWCAVFACWCAHRAGADAPLAAGCTTARGIWRALGRWREAGYTPKPGDLVYFDWDGSGDCDHVGVAENCLAGFVWTIEGNSASAVRRRRYALDDSRIAGFGLPDFGPEEEDYGGAPEWLVREGAAKWLVENGIFKGDGDGAFRWEGFITRAEAGALIYRALTKTEGK